MGTLRVPRLGVVLHRGAPGGSGEPRDGKGASRVMPGANGLCHLPHTRI